MDGYKADLGRIMAFIGLVGAELNMLALEAHMMRRHIEDTDPEHTLCAREQAFKRMRFIARQCRNAMLEEAPAAPDAPAAAAGT